MQSPDLSAIHLTLVETDADCDTFMPPVDESRFRLWSAAAPRRDTPAGPRYSFLCYTRAGQEGAPVLPPAVASQHEELQVRALCGETGSELLAGGETVEAGGAVRLRELQDGPWAGEFRPGHQGQWGLEGDAQYSAAGSRTVPFLACFHSPPSRPGLTQPLAVGSGEASQNEAAAAPGA